MIVLAWIGQILLFFVAWKLVHLGVATAAKQIELGIFGEILTNVILAILLLIFFSTITSNWWLMILVGAVIGVVTGKVGAYTSRRG